VALVVVVLVVGALEVNGDFSKFSWCSVRVEYAYILFKNGLILAFFGFCYNERFRYLAL